MHFFTQWLKPSAKSTSAPEKKLSGLSIAAAIPSRLLPLWELYQQRQLLEVRWNSSQLTYQTSIIAFDVERNLLWLDDVTPLQHQMDVQDSIRIRCSKQEKEMIVDGEILAFGREYGATGFAIELPYQPTYTLKRQHPRFSCENLPASFATIRTLGGENMLGVIQDISVGGIKLSLYGNHTQQLRPNAPLAYFDFQLSGQKTIKEPARITSVRFMKNESRITQVGIEFADKSPEALEKRAELLHYWLHSHVRLRTA